MCAAGNSRATTSRSSPNSRSDAMIDSRLDGPIGRITLNSPATHNALDFAALRGLTALLEGWAGHDELRALVVTGTGRSFCSGVSLGDVAGMDWTDNPLTRLCDTLEVLPRPDHRRAERRGLRRRRRTRPRLRLPRRCGRHARLRPSRPARHPLRGRRHRPRRAAPRAADGTPDLPAGRGFEAEALLDGRFSRPSGGAQGARGQGRRN